MKKFAMLSGALATISSGWVYAQTDVERSDFDGSGTVDFADFLTFASGFGTATGEAGFNAQLDLDGSKTVDFGDFLVFAQNFGRSTDDPEVTFLYVADTVLGEVRAYNAATNFQDVSRQINVPFPRNVEYAADTNQLYVSALDTFYAFTSSSTPIFTIPLTEESYLGFVTSRGGSKMAVSPDQRTAYTSEQLPAVEVVNLETAQSEELIIVRPNPAGIGVSPDGSRIYVPVSRVVNIVGADGVPTIGFAGGLVAIDATTFVAAEEIAIRRDRHERRPLA